MQKQKNGEKTAEAKNREKWRKKTAEAKTSAAII
jgi:hypothetical protein